LKGKYQMAIIKAKCPNFQTNRCGKPFNKNLLTFFCTQIFAKFFGKNNIETWKNVKPAVKFWLLQIFN